MKLILCRHGETDLNAQNRYVGLSEAELNEKGISQAEKIAEKLKNEKFDVAFTSPLLRCKQTADIIMNSHSETELVTREELNEIDYGEFSGKNVEEIEKEKPGIFKIRRADKYGFLHKNGESFKEIDEKRVKPLLKEFQEKYSSRTILVVSHQGIGTLILGNLLGLSPKEKMSISIPNGCIYYIDYLPHKTSVKYYLVDEGIGKKGLLKREFL